MSREYNEDPQVGRIGQVVAHGDLTDQGGAYGTLDMNSDLPDGAVVLGSRARVIQAFDGTNPDITVGTGSDVDRFQVGSEVGIGSTGEKDLGQPNGQPAVGSGGVTPQVRIGEDTDFGNISQGQVYVEVLYVKA